MFRKLFPPLAGCCGPQERGTRASPSCHCSVPTALPPGILPLASPPGGFPILMACHWPRRQKKGKKKPQSKHWGPLCLSRMSRMHKRLFFLPEFIWKDLALHRHISQLTSVDNLPASAWVYP